MCKQISSNSFKNEINYKLFTYKSYILLIKSIWLPSKIFISHSKSVIFISHGKNVIFIPHPKNVIFIPHPKNVSFNETS